MRVQRSLVPALEGLHTRLADLAAAHAATVKLGRTHLMDAVPMTFGQEAGGWARAVEQTAPLIAAAGERLHELALGGTAVGTGLNAPPGFGAEMADRARHALRASAARGGRPLRVAGWTGGTRGVERCVPHGGVDDEQDRRRHSVAGIGTVPAEWAKS